MTTSDLADSLNSMADLAQRTDRADVLAEIERRCGQNLDTLKEGIARVARRRQRGSWRYADLLGMYRYHADLMAFCRNKV
jgi:hypothetical protein